MHAACALVRHRRRLAVTIGTALLLCACVFSQARAESNTDNSGALAAVARLDFTVNIGKFMFLRVGTVGSGINTVTFDLSPTIAPGAVSPLPGSNVPINWDGSAPVFSVAATGHVVPVEVRSNAGQVSLRATTTAALTSGSDTIPMSHISVTSNNADLPAPVLVNTGTGSGVNVTGSTFGNLVTVRAADWTFGYAPTPATLPAAGNYSGQITFSASAP